jgi:hypothetical protein
VTYGVWYCGRDLKPIRAEYQPFDRVMSSSIRLTVVNLRAMKGYGWRVLALFIFNSLVLLSGQLRAPAALATGKYSPVDLSGERRLCGFTGGLDGFQKK